MKGKVIKLPFTSMYYKNPTYNICCPYVCTIHFTNVHIMGSFETAASKIRCFLVYKTKVNNKTETHQLYDQQQLTVHFFQSTSAYL